MLRVVVQALALTFVVPSAALADPSPVPSPSPPPAGSLPFGRIKFGPTGLDRSGIVWSRCRGADGGEGRWVGSKATEIVRPTYIVERNALIQFRSRTEFANQDGFVECVAADGNPGTPDPAIPPVSVLPLKTKVVYERGVMVHDAATSPENSPQFMYGTGGDAIADPAGPVVVSDERILIFPATYTIDKSRYSEKVSIERPDMPRRSPPASCAIVLYERPGRERTVATLSHRCTELSADERTRAITDAREKR